MKAEDFDADLVAIDNPENTIIQVEEKRQLYSAMNKINPDYRTVLHLLYFENMSYDEVAFVLRKSKKQINNLAYRAKQALKAEMKKGGFIYENKL